MTAEVFAQHIHCAVHVYYEGRALKQMKPQLFSFPLEGPCPSPNSCLNLLDPRSLFPGPRLQALRGPSETLKLGCSKLPSPPLWVSGSLARLALLGGPWNRRGSEEAHFSVGPVLEALSLLSGEEHGW